MRILCPGWEDPLQEGTWQPSPVFLPGEFHGQRSPVGYSPRGCKESDTTEQLSIHHAHLVLFPLVSLDILPGFACISATLSAFRSLCILWVFFFFFFFIFSEFCHTLKWNKEFGVVLVIRESIRYEFILSQKVALSTTTIQLKSKYLLMTFDSQIWLLPPSHTTSCFIFRFAGNLPTTPVMFHHEHYKLVPL